MFNGYKEPPLERGRQEETRGLERVDSEPGPGAPFSSLKDTVITKVPAAFFLNLSPVFPFSKGGWGRRPQHISSSEAPTVGRRLGGEGSEG